jgi:hypothetical protein
MTKSVLNYFALAAASSSDTRTQTLKPHDVEKEKKFSFLFTACRLLHVVIQSRQTYTHGPDNRGKKCCQKWWQFFKSVSDETGRVDDGRDIWWLLKSLFRHFSLFLSLVHWIWSDFNRDIARGDVSLAIGVGLSMHMYSIVASQRQSADKETYNKSFKTTRTFFLFWQVHQSRSSS